MPHNFWDCEWHQSQVPDAGETARHREPATSFPCEIGEATAGAMLCLVEHVHVAEERSIWDDSVNATVTSVEAVEVGTKVSAVRWKCISCRLICIFSFALEFQYEYRLRSMLPPIPSVFQRLCVGNNLERRLGGAAEQ